MNSVHALYDLSILNDTYDIADILDELDEEEYGDLFNAVDSEGVGFDYVYWPECDEDMFSLSEKYPDVVFCLKMRGECNNDDLWIAYYQNGKVQKEEGKIVYPEFDPKLLV